MKPFPHRYDARLVGGPAGYAELSSTGLPGLTIESPADFDGPGDAWSPEHLLLGAVEACFLLTFRAIARKSRLEFTSLDVAASGVVDRRDGITRFTEITLRPTLVLAAAGDEARARDLLIKAEKHCLVSASLSTPVELDPTISIGSAVA